MRDGVIIGAATATALAFHFVPVRERVELRDWELFGGLDMRVRDNYSPLAAYVSDGLLATTVIVPSAFAIGTDGDEAAGDRALIMGETLSLTLATTAIAKLVVARPRPYAYNSSAAASRKRDEAGRDAYRSFYSGHAAMSFAAATAGGILYAGRTTSETNRALVWGAGAMLATSTANLRVRAGRHFYSDVLIGALVGTGFGIAIPSLHAGELYTPTAREWAGIGGGVVLGALASQLIPFPGGGRGSDVPPRVQLMPILVEGGTGVALGGTL